jgi:hypothetical protein
VVAASPNVTTPACVLSLLITNPFAIWRAKSFALFQREVPEMSVVIDPDPSRTNITSNAKLHDLAEQPVGIKLFFAVYLLNLWEVNVTMVFATGTL